MDKKDINVRIGELLKARRLALGMTQRGVAEKAKMQSNSIIHIEKGRRGISVQLLERLCKVLELKIKLEEKGK